MWPFKRRIRDSLSDQYTCTVQARNTWKSEKNTLILRIRNANNGELKRELKKAQERGAWVLGRLIERELNRRGQ